MAAIVEGPGVVLHSATLSTRGGPVQRGGPRAKVWLHGWDRGPSEKTGVRCLMSTDVNIEMVGVILQHYLPAKTAQVVLL